MASALERGQKLMKKGEKAALTTMFRWKPDWEMASQHFEEGAGLLRSAGALGEAKLAYEKASDAQDQLGNQFAAARLLEQSLGVAKEMGGLGGSQAVEMYKRVSSLYAVAGRGQRAAEALSAGGRALEAAGDTRGAAALHLQACDMFEEEGKEAFAGDAFRAAVAVQLRGGEAAGAVGTLLRFGQACAKAGQAHSLRKAYLSAVLAWLHAGDAKAAEDVHRDVQDVPQFADSEENTAAWALLDAYREGDAAKVQACVKRYHCFSHLDQAFVRVAKGLPGAGNDLGAMARQLGAAAEAQTSWAEQEGLDDDDLT